MMGTLFSLIIAIFLIFNPTAQEALPGIPGISFVMITAALLLLIFMTLVFLMSWIPLQSAEQNLTPRVMSMFRQDRQLRLTDIWMVFFFLLTLVFVLDLTLTEVVSDTLLLIIWVVALGFSMDLMHHLMKRVMSYFDPFAVVEHFTQQAKLSIQKNQEIELCVNIDALTEVAIKAVSRNSTALANHSLNEMEIIARNFLESAKSIVHPLEDRETKELGIADNVSYTLFYIFQRMEMIFTKALEQRIEPTCSYVVTALGKIAIHAAYCDLTLTGHPIRCLGNLSILAEKAKLKGVGDKAICTLMQVATTLVTEVNIQYGDLKDPFYSIIAQFHAISREMFRQDKTTNFKILTQPFYELKELLKHDKIINHQDTPAIVAEVDRVLQEFITLEAVMKTIPPIPEIDEEE